MAGSEVQRWADKAMYRAIPTASEDGGPVFPTVHLLAAQADPLGAIAGASLMYQGKPVRSLSEVTDEQRRWFWEDIKRTRLDSPFEFVDFHFMIEGVTRAFTHQMVRQRTAVYVQESQRFAVKDNGESEVALPPSLYGTLPMQEYIEQQYAYQRTLGLDPDRRGEEWEMETLRSAPAAQQQRFQWDDTVGDIAASYMTLVNAGMPAEDARGLLPTNITTRIHYKSNLRGMIGHAGNRLCTQAQFEWRLVWTGIVKALRQYGRDQVYTKLNEFGEEEQASSLWQFEEISQVFRPICYLTGKCEFMSKMDRHCNIRERVEAFHAAGITSERWSEGAAGIPGIHESEWLADPAAARVMADA